MKIKWVFVLFIIMAFKDAGAFVGRDTMRMAKSLIKERKFKSAEKLLYTFHQSHPDDLNTLWLFAQTAYWAKDYHTFNSAYSAAMQKFPANYYLKLDYALKLVENGDVKKAIPLLETYQQFDSTALDVKLALAKINYWQGHFAKALQILNGLTSKKGKSNSTVDELKTEILSAKSPWIKVNCNYISDDQPLKIISPSVEAGTYISPLLAPSVSFSTPSFSRSSGSSMAKSVTIGNKINFFKEGVAMNFNAGFIQLPNKTNTLTGSVEISKTNLKYLQVSARIAHQPYLTTLSSLDSTVVPTIYSFSAGWNKPNSWNAKFISNYNQFSIDLNAVYNLGGWIFTPAYKFQKLNVRVGYAYSFSSSKENRYQSKLSLAQVITNAYSGNENVEGIYSPYFTPNHQNVHSALLNINIHPSQKLSIGVNASIGFLGTVKNPYLFLDTSKIDPFINTGYYTVKFYPDEISSYILLQLNSKSSLVLNYSFLRNNFYTSHSAGLTFKTSFWNEQKKK